MKQLGQWDEVVPNGREDQVCSEAAGTVLNTGAARTSGLRKVVEVLTSGTRISGKLFLLCTLLMVALSAVSTRTVLAQDTTGTILGDVKDPSGAAIPKADVTITNTATNISTVVRTTETGAYTVPQLIPGPYSVTVKVQGFEQPALRSLISLPVIAVVPT